MLSRESSAYAWLRRTIELLAEGSNPEEFLEHTKLELFHDQVFCFTPKGKLIALPRGNAISLPFGVKQNTWSWNSSSLVCSRNSSGLEPSANSSMVRRSHA